MSEPFSDEFIARGKPAISIRTALLLLAGGALVYVSIIAAMVAWRILPVTRELTRDSHGLAQEYEATNGRAAQLDAVMTDLWVLLGRARSTPISMDALEAHRHVLQLLEDSSHTLARLSMPIEASTELRTVMARSAVGEAELRSTMLGAVAALELADVALAERLLRRADSLDTPFSADLREATALALQGVQEKESRLSAVAAQSAVLLWLWLAAGVLALPAIVLFLRRRLHEPLGALDRGMARVARGDLSVSVESHRDDEAGRLTRHFNIMTSVLRQRAAAERERTAMESAARTRLILDAALDAVIVVDASGTVLEWNPQAERLFGWTRDELIGRPLPTNLVPSLAHVHLVPQAERETVGRRFESAGTHRDGNALTLELTITPIEKDGSVEYSAFIRDVTESKRLEEDMSRVQKMDAVGRLAGGIAHDFNNLLAAVIGYADLLQFHEGLAEDVRADARSISTSAKRGADLARNLLTLSRRHPTKRAPVLIDAVVQEVVTIARRTFDRRIVLETELRGFHTTLLGDASELSNALLNLAVNARDAMPDGGQLTFTTSVATLDAAFWRGRAEEPAPGEYVVLAVSDTGIGMSAETRARAFEPFFTTKDVGKGTGLGLAMVYSTVTSHRGLIDIASTPGRGTTFTLYFPSMSTSPIAESADDEPVPGTGRILLCDDDDAVRDSTARMLRALGYDVHTVPNGVDALARVRGETRPYDLVIVDGNMPILSGRDTTRRIRELDASMPVLLVSGHVEHALGDDGDTAGIFSGVLTKPFSWPQLSRAVATCKRASRMPAR